VASRGWRILGATFQLSASIVCARPESHPQRSHRIKHKSISFRIASKGLCRAPEASGRQYERAKIRSAAPPCHLRAQAFRPLAMESPNRKHTVARRTR
jgi:hypothetical protein